MELVIQGGKQSGKRLSLPESKTIVVGREEGCQLVLNSTLVSRRHCELKQSPQGIWVTDLGSQNGTYVNEIAITESTLMTNGDTVRIGPLVMEAQSATAQIQSTTPATAPMVTPKRRKDPGLSDDEIAAWLGEGTPNPNAAKHDTVVYDTVPPAVKAAADQKTQEAKPSAAVPAKKFRSVKEEAADIIRRHWAKVRGEQSPEYATGS